jgi:hypothetical protein
MASAAVAVNNCSNCNQGPAACHRQLLVGESKSKSWARALVESLSAVEDEKDYGARNAILRQMQSHILEVIRCHNKVQSDVRKNQIKIGAGRGKQHSDEEKKTKRLTNCQDTLKCAECGNRSEDGLECNECDSSMCDDCCILSCEACDSLWCKICVPDYVLCDGEGCGRLMCYQCIDKYSKEGKYECHCANCGKKVKFEPAFVNTRPGGTESGGTKRKRANDSDGDGDGDDDDQEKKKKKKAKVTVVRTPDTVSAE